ncbi:hypothetical protein [Nocardia salmonicida]|uniref:hypothetical protein n=1 Tax=Nocardia salmonicida TaxID=53431 RepID=UPI0034000AB8
MKRTAVAAIAAATLLATGCANDTPAQAPPVTVFVTPSSTAAAPGGDGGIPKAEKSPRGNLIKTVGTPGASGPSNGPVSITFTVTRITVDEPCSEKYASNSRRGHFVVLDFDVETSPSYQGGSGDGFHPGNDWSLVDATGLTLPHADSVEAYSCHDNTWPTDMQPASKYRFRLTFDSPTPTGILIYSPDDDSGWEWAF